MEYSRNFQDNIPANEFNERTNGIANWIEENKEVHDWAKDPNAYEMTNVFLFAGKHIEDGNDVNIQSVKRIWELRSQDFERCGISEEHFVYQICKQSYESAISGKALVDDENSHSALRKMSGIGLYLMQEKRDKGTVEYNNFNELVNLIEDSKMLKIKHPDLYKTFRFDNNLKFLYEMQVNHLNDKTKAMLDKVANINHQEETKKDFSNNSRELNI